jgi:quercetin dioxygenase-like cupin family protein
MTAPRLPEPLWFLEHRMTILADAESTGGRLSVVDGESPRGGGPALHRHPTDETFIVVDGEVAFVVDGDVRRLGPGGCAVIPGGTPHSFRVLSERARMLVVGTPAGLEELFRLAGRPAEDDGLPPAGPPDLEGLARAAAVVGAEFLGPPPPELAALDAVASPA